MKIVVTTIFDGIPQKVNYLADSWSIEMGYLTLFQDGEECATFPPSAWRSVVRRRGEESGSISIDTPSRHAHRLMEALQKRLSEVEDPAVSTPVEFRVAMGSGFVMVDGETFRL